jgi:hypothetical protein
LTAFENRAPRIIIDHGEEVRNFEKMHNENVGCITHCKHEKFVQKVVSLREHTTLEDRCRWDNIKIYLKRNEV